MRWEHIPVLSTTIIHIIASIMPYIFDGIELNKNCGAKKACILIYLQKK